MCPPNGLDADAGIGDISNMKITFLGAAGEVTGSQHLIETSRRRILLDCGFFQGPRAESRKKNERLHCDPKRLDAVVLSHAHLDHCGNLPRLFKLGFRGPIFCTQSTAELAEIMLMDSATIQVEDALYLSRKLKGDHPPIEPLYTAEDVTRVMKLFEPCPFYEWQSVGRRDEVRIRFTAAGHLLGSAIVELEVDDAGEQKRIVYTGDLGRRKMPLLVDPDPVPDGADVLICESTYGDQIHATPEDLKQVMRQILHDTFQSGGKVIIPAFALGRTQQVTYHLNELFNSRQLPPVPIYVDSPLGSKVTRLFRDHTGELDSGLKDVLTYDDDPFSFEGLTYVKNQRESIELNRRHGSFVVIASSGMCENGRVVHHLKHAVSSPENTILLLGYQAPHTLGRQLAERRPFVRIFNQDLPLKAKVLQMDGLSAHADANDLKWWFEESTRYGHFGKAFLVHGEPRAAESLAQLVRDHVDEDPIIPRYRESFEV